jgi:type IV fimbrial biogenesis protein FimT
MQNSKRQHGFTLIELLVLIAIVSILATVAVPDFSATIKNDRDISQLNTLINSISLARSEAIRTNAKVSICAGSDTTCSGTSWASGWVVYYDTLPPGITNPIIRVFPALSGNNTFTDDSGSYNYTFQGNGTLSPTPPVSINFTLCDVRGPVYARSMNLAPFGRAEAAAKVGYKVDGATPLTCP